MIEIALCALAVLVAGGVAWAVGRRAGARGVERPLSSLLGGLRRGSVPDTAGGGPGEPPPVRELRTLLARDWIPRERACEEALEGALHRLASYLARRVKTPLAEALEEGKGLRSGIQAALDAVEDLEFFLEDPVAEVSPDPVSLVEVVRSVVRDFTGQSEVMVKMEVPEEAIRARMSPEAFKDAVFLVLYNAGEFGGGKPIRVTLGRGQGQARVLIRDEGPGFSAEALLQARNPFYSTSPDGLGLGLPYARKALQAQGGEIFLRNREGGGAEVEIVLPEVR